MKTILIKGIGTPVHPYIVQYDVEIYVSIDGGKFLYSGKLIYNSRDMDSLKSRAKGVVAKDLREPKIMDDESIEFKTDLKHIRVGEKPPEH